MFGGLHLPSASDAEVARVAAALHDTYKVERMAPGHCTGEPAFYHFKKVWKDRYTYAGVGSILSGSAAVEQAASTSPLTRQFRSPLP